MQNAAALTRAALVRKLQESPDEMRPPADPTSPPEGDVAGPKMPKAMDAVPGLDAPAPTMGMAKPKPVTDTRGLFNEAINQGLSGEGVIDYFKQQGITNNGAYYPDSGNYGFNEFYAAPNGAGGFDLVNRTPHGPQAPQVPMPTGPDYSQSDLLQQIMDELKATQAGQASPALRNSLMTKLGGR